MILCILGEKMTVYKTFENDSFKIEYPIDLENFTLFSVKNAMDSIKKLKTLFKTKESLKLNANFFNIREDFVKYIKQYSTRKEIPDWIMGCFYNNGIQLYIDKNSSYQLNKMKYTLLHETVHLYFTNYIYDKYNIKRICWFDEAYANHLDKCPKDIKQILQTLELPIDFNMSSLSNPERNAYGAFNLIGYYIFSTHQEKKLLNLLIKDSEQIRELGKTILKKAVEYIKNKQPHSVSTNGVLN